MYIQYTYTHIMCIMKSKVWFAIITEDEWYSTQNIYKSALSAFIKCERTTEF
jgi:hypothetical protein